MPSPMSRYKFCQLVAQDDGTVMLTDRVPFEFQPGLTGTQLYSAQRGDTWRTIAHRFWRAMFGQHAGDLWWLLADFQPASPTDPTIAIAPGTVIHVPGESTVLAVFDESRRAEFR